MYSIQRTTDKQPQRPALNRSIAIKNTTLNTKAARDAAELTIDKMPGHWLLARMGKRVLRPGGLELTRQLLNALAIDERDDVVEFAPGLGVTARMTLARKPSSYTAIERDRDAADVVSAYLSTATQRCIVGTAEQNGLSDECATVVYGEAMLSMQPAATKSRIVAEAARLLRPGGRYGIHEMCLVPDDLDASTRDAIQKELTQKIHVGVRPLTLSEWRQLLESAGLTIVAETTAPMHLLEPRRLLKDEGFIRALRFIGNVIRHKSARRRVLAMRSIFRKYAAHLAAIVVVARNLDASPSSPSRPPRHAGSHTAPTAFIIPDPDDSTSKPARHTVGRDQTAFMRKGAEMPCGDGSSEVEPR